MPRVIVQSEVGFQLYPGVDDFARGKARIGVELCTPDNVSLEEQLRDSLEAIELARGAVTAAMANQVLATLHEVGGEIPRDEEGNEIEPKSVDDILSLIGTEARVVEVEPQEKPKPKPKAKPKPKPVESNEDDEELM